MLIYNLVMLMMNNLIHANQVVLLSVAIQLNIIKSIINEDNINYSSVGNIDLDRNLLIHNFDIICKNYIGNDFNTSFSDLSCFSIFHVNIRSIPENLVKLVYYLQDIEHQFSVFAISETWLKNYNDSIHNLKGYTHVKCNCKQRITQQRRSRHLYYKYYFI